jgi:flavin reductase (DIM6/NTAB) family NADH-FMN oxidoreductase RutF
MNPPSARMADARPLDGTAPSAGPPSASRGGTCPARGATGSIFRQAMGRLVSGVSVVTAMAGGEPHGMTISSLISVSLQPPLLLVSLTAGSRTAEAAGASGRFGVSILSAAQEMIARRFASPGTDHFAGLPVTYGDHDVPIVPNALVHLECAANQTVTAGDHLLVVGEVLRVCQRAGDPLAFREGLFGDFTDRGHEPVLWAF